MTDVSLLERRTGDDLEFAVDLYKAVAATTAATSNVVLSPCSVQLVLATLYPAAGGDTAKELSTLLRLKSRSLDELATALNLATKRPTAVVSYVFRAANAVFFDDHIPLRTEFFQNIPTVLQDSVHSAPFQQDHDVAQRAVERFVKEATGGDLSQGTDGKRSRRDTQMALISAVTFKVQWEDPFYPQMTVQEAFTTADGLVKTLPMMFQQPWNHYYIYPDGTRIVKAKQRGGVGKVMLVLPPDGEAMSAFEQRLSPSMLLGMFREERRFPASLHIPRFRVQTQVDLAPIIATLGGSTLFGSKGDYSGIINSTALRGATTFTQKAVVEVDEAGALDTGLTMMDYVLCYMEHFRANRPFLFSVWHIELALPILMCRIADPTL